MRKLDRSKHFNEVVGDDPNIDYRYLQDGVKFDNQGNEIVERGKKSVVASEDGDADVKAATEAKAKAEADAKKKADADAKKATKKATK